MSDASEEYNRLQELARLRSHSTMLGQICAVMECEELPDGMSTLQAVEKVVGERDQLKADNQALQMKHDLLLAKIEAIQLRDCQRDADVIERFISERLDEWPASLANQLSLEAREYANQLRQQAGK